jgi:hypothetical protein
MVFDPNPNRFTLSDAHGHSSYGKTVSIPRMTAPRAWLRKTRGWPLPQLAFERRDGRPIAAGSESDFADARSVDRRGDEFVHARWADSERRSRHAPPTGRTGSADSDTAAPGSLAVSMALPEGTIRRPKTIRPSIGENLNRIRRRLCPKPPGTRPGSHPRCLGLFRGSRPSFNPHRTSRCPCVSPERGESRQLELPCLWPGKSIIGPGG